MSLQQSKMSSQEPPLLNLSEARHLEQFSVTCIACRANFLAIGSSAGNVLILSAKTFKTLAAFKSGTGGTFEIDFDRTGNFIITSDLDGTILVRTNILEKQDEVWDERHSASFLVTSGLRVALDPNCSKKDDFTFISGGSEGKLYITKKTWLFRSKTSELGQCPFPTEGGIRRISWREDLVAWTSENGGLKMYDINLEKIIGQVPRLKPLENELEKDLLAWEDDETLILSWGNRIGIIRVKKDFNPLKPRYATVLLWLEMDYLVKFVSPYGGRNGKLLIVSVDGIFRLVERKNGTVFFKLEDLKQSEFVINFDSYWNTSVDGSVPDRATVQSESKLPFIFIASNSFFDDDHAEDSFRIRNKNVSQLLVVKSRTVEDCLQYAIFKGDFSQALQISRGARTVDQQCSMNELEVAELWLTSLFQKHQYDIAVSILTDILLPFQSSSSDVKNAIIKLDNSSPYFTSWAKWCLVLAERRELYRIADRLPAGLPSTIYHSALNEVLVLGEDDKFVELLRRYLDFIDEEKMSKEISEAIDQIKNSNSGDNEKFKTQMLLVNLNSALVLAYSKMPDRFEDAFWAMLNAGSHDAFDVLERRDLDQSLLIKVIEKEKVAELFMLDIKMSVDLFLPLLTGGGIQGMSFEEQLNYVSLIIKQLCHEKRVNLEFPALLLLRKFNKLEAANQYHFFDLEVELCSKYQPERFLELLRDSNRYSPNKALEICRQNEGKFRKELVFLLQKLGGPKHSKEALEILVYELNDIDSALHYAETDDLFDQLVRICMTSPKNAAQLLEKAGGYNIDPARLIRALPGGLPKFKEKLMKLLADVRANQMTRKVANDVLLRETEELAPSILRQFRHGVKVKMKAQACKLCGLKLLDKSQHFQDLVVFRTGDSYHFPCIDKYSEFARVKTELGDELSAAKLPMQHCLIFHAAVATKNNNGEERKTDI